MRTKSIFKFFFKKKDGLFRLIYFFLIIYFCFSPFNVISAVENSSKKIAVCIVATGNYIEYAKKFITSAREFFLPNHLVSYFVFSDTEIIAPDIIWIFQEKQKWPFGTLMRFEIYQKQKDRLCDFDYIFAIDADMLCVDYIGDEILAKSVATLHPGYAIPRRNNNPVFDSNKKSCVYLMPSKQKRPYFAGAFYGGGQEEFIKLITICSLTVRHDLRNNIIALFHDESHLNWYFRRYKPVKILSPSYCYPNDDEAIAYLLKDKFQKKILCLSKDENLYPKN